MAKKRRKQKAAADMLSVITEETHQVETPAETPAKEDPGPPSLGLCGVCQKKRKQEIAFYDCDEHWELPGHPDHIFRSVCVNCAGDYAERGKCAELVYAAMREAFAKKGMGVHEIESAVHVMWRTFWVDLDDEALIKMSRKLKVNHPWTKGKKTK